MYPYLYIIHSNRLYVKLFPAIYLVKIQGSIKASAVFPNEPPQEPFPSKKALTEMAPRTGERGNTAEAVKKLDD